MHFALFVPMCRFELYENLPTEIREQIDENDVQLQTIETVFRENDLLSTDISKAKLIYLSYPITMYEGIASDETDRLKGMHKNRNHLSLLEKYGVNESETYEILRPYNLLSPIYKTRRRQGCWFCPSQNAAEAADFKLHYPHIWSLLKPLAEITSRGMTNAKCFRYNKTFEEFEKEVDEYIKNPPPIQLTMLDMMNSLVID